MFRKMMVIVSILLSMSSIQVFAAGDTTPPPKLNGVSTQVPVYRTGEIDLKWRSSLVGDVFGYNVYVNGVKQQPIPYFSNPLGCTLTKPSYFTTYTEYYIYNLTAGKYVISVTVVDQSGNESVPFTTTVFVR